MSAGSTSSVPGRNVGANRPSASKTDSTPIVSRPVTRVVADEPLRAAAVDDADALALGFGDLFGFGRNLLGRLEGHDRHVVDARSNRGAGHVERRRHRTAGVLGGGAPSDR